MNYCVEQGGGEVIVIDDFTVVVISDPLKATQGDRLLLSPRLRQVRWKIR